MTMHVPMCANMYMLFQSMLAHKQILFKFILLCLFLINAYTFQWQLCSSVKMRMHFQL